MTSEKKAELNKALRYWLASFALAAGFFYYKSSAPLGPILIAGFVTFLIIVGRAWYKRPETHLPS